MRFYFYAYLLLISGWYFGNHLYAQGISINTTGAAPDGSALLDVVGSSSGILIPRVALVATNNTAPISNPATSLLIYNTAVSGSGNFEVTPGYYYWDGVKWVRFILSTDDISGDEGGGGEGGGGSGEYYNCAPTIIEDFNSGYPLGWSRTSNSSVFVTDVCAYEDSSLQIWEFPGQYAQSYEIDLGCCYEVNYNFRYRSGNTSGCGNRPETEDSVLVQYWDGSSWVDLYNFNGSYAATPHPWTYKDTSFASPQNTDFKLRFYLGNAGGSNGDSWNFDDINLTCSLAESSKGERFVNGDPIYQAVINMGDLSTGTTTKDLSALGIGRLINSRVAYYYDNPGFWNDQRVSGTFHFQPGESGQQSVDVTYDAMNENLELLVRCSCSAIEGVYVIIEYTKPN